MLVGSPKATDPQQRNSDLQVESEVLELCK